MWCKNNNCTHYDKKNNKCTRVGLNGKVGICWMASTEGGILKINL